MNPQSNSNQTNEQPPRFASADERTKVLAELIGKLTNCIIKVANRLEEAKPDKDPNGPEQHQDQ